MSLRVFAKLIQLAIIILLISGSLFIVIYWENEYNFYFYIVLLFVIYLFLISLHKFIDNKFHEEQRVENDRLETIYLSNAERCFENNDYIKSIEYYTKILNIKPGNLLYLSKRGFLYEQLCDYSNALDDYSQVEKFANQVPIDIIHRKAQVFIKINNYKNAINEYDKILMNEKNSVKYLEERAFLYFQIKEFNKSMIDYLAAKENGSLIALQQIIKIKEHMLEVNSIVSQSKLKDELLLNHNEKRIINEKIAEDAKISDYPNQISDLKNVSFENVRAVSVRYINTLKINNPERAEVLLQKINRGNEILTTSEELHQYKYSYDLKHKVKLDFVFKSFLEKTNLFTLPFKQTIDIIDWGCGQALGTFLFLEHISKLSNCEIDINKIILSDPSEIALKRGVCLLNNKLKTENRFSPLIKSINKKIKDVSENDIVTLNSNIKIHILSNIIDMDDLKIFDLFSLVCKSQRNKNFFLCVSPLFNTSGVIDYRNQKMLEFKSLFTNNFEVMTELSFKMGIIEHNTTIFENTFFVDINHTPEIILLKDHEKYEEELLKEKDRIKYILDGLKDKDRIKYILDDVPF